MITPSEIDALRREFQSDLEKALTAEDIETVRVLWLGRKGKVTSLLKQLGTLSIEEKKEAGPILNQLRGDFDTRLSGAELQARQKERAKALELDTTDISLPGVTHAYGHEHPVSQVMVELVSIFRALGFVCADGPEIESEYFNFEALNVPEDHPARDMQDTFYLTPFNEQLSLPQIGDLETRREPTLLRTHTSPVQVHVMHKYAPPIAIVCPGRVYRHEAEDATHLATFHQMEGLLIDEGISFADLKGTLSQFARMFFAPTVKTRFKPSFFPFTEPSAQMDVSCYQCAGAGCRTCKQTGWIELLGAGMVNPNVFAKAKIDSEKYSGFAFGVGVERLAMIRYGLDDLRQLYENDVRFLAQF
jgi:phenylalanyl-tRNA synthetase alpha chain